MDCTRSVGEMRLLMVTLPWKSVCNTEGHFVVLLKHETESLVRQALGG